MIFTSLTFEDFNIIDWKKIKEVKDSMFDEWSERGCLTPWEIVAACCCLRTKRR